MCLLFIKPFEKYKQVYYREKWHAKRKSRRHLHQLWEKYHAKLLFLPNTAQILPFLDLIYCFFFF